MSHGQTEERWQYERYRYIWWIEEIQWNPMITHIDWSDAIHAGYWIWLCLYVYTEKVKKQPFLQGYHIRCNICTNELHITIWKEDVTKDQTEKPCLTVEIPELAPKTFLLPKHTSPSLHSLCQTATVHDIFLESGTFLFTGRCSIKVKIEIFL